MKLLKVRTCVFLFLGFKQVLHLGPTMDFLLTLEANNGWGIKTVIQYKL